jgi:predicted nucleotidyltransferase
MQNDSLPPDIDEKTRHQLEALREKLDVFHNKIMDRFNEYILGTALMPPLPDKPEKTAVLLLIDDSDSKKMPKQELREKLHAIFVKEAEAVDPNIEPETLLLSELWGYCEDGKYEILATIAQSAPIVDKGMLQAIKLAEIHKQMVLKKFEKYIVCYILAGSLVQGTATSKSDIDVFIVIDDTDVKKMTRAELKDKLRAIIIDMGFQAQDLTGIKNPINIQVYILTDFWDNVKEANPVIFTFLRDGIPFADRGIFMPWKQLLQMGKIKPSPEAIDLYISSGDQMIKRVEYKLKEIGMEDVFWATITPSQAALMLFGLPPPTPKETPGVLREVFVKKEGLLTDEDVDKFQRILKTRKDLEHGTKATITGKELDELMHDAETYLKRLNKLFEEINQRKEEEAVLHTYENTVTITRDALRIEGITDAPEAKLHDLFEKHVISKGHVPEKYSRYLKDIVAAKKEYDKKKLTKTDISEATKKGREYFKILIEHIQRSRTRDLERCRIRVKHGQQFGEVLFLKDKVFIVHDVQKQEGFSSAKLDEHGGLTHITASTIEEYEHALTNPQLPDNLALKEKLFEQLKTIFGGDVEVVL